MEISEWIQKAQRNELPLADLLVCAEKLQKLSDSESALALYSAWTEESTDAYRHVAMFNHGSLLQSLGRLDDAERVYRNCTKIAPTFGQPYINLGLTLEKKGLREEGIGVWSNLLDLARKTPGSVPDDMQVLALNHRGRVQEDLKQYDLAEASLQMSLTIHPKQAAAIQHWVHIRQKACSWPVYKTLPGVSDNSLLMATSPLAMLALTDDPVQLLLTSHAFVHRTYAVQEEYLVKGPYEHQIKRIGYVSGDFCVHAVGLLLAELLEGHDRTQYEIYGYDYSPEDGTEHRARLKNSFDHIRFVHQLTDRQVAEAIVIDEIDFLIDLHGLSSGARPGIFACHPAPKQGTYLGFMGTTAMPWFDFVITDKNVFPDQLAHYFAEKPLFIKRCFIPLTPDVQPDGALTRQSLGLPDHAFVMAAFGNAYKITPKLFETWMNILHACDSALLWLIDENPVTTTNLKKQIDQAKINKQRVIFTQRTNYADYKKRLLLADVFLDTFPYNCGSTSNNVVQAGLPMVSMFGRSMVSRMGLSILSQIGLEDLCVSTYDQYQETVLRIAKMSPLERLDLRARIKPDLTGLTMAAAIEQALENLVLHEH